MSRTRHILAAAMLGLAFAAGGCGDEDEDGAGQTNNNDSVVQDEASPDQDPGNTAPGPGSDTVPNTTRTDGE